MEAQCDRVDRLIVRKAVEEAERAQTYIHLVRRLDARRNSGGHIHLGWLGFGRQSLG